MEQIKVELQRRHNAGEKTGDDRLNLDALEVIEQLQAELLKYRWIPVDERLPKEKKETVPYRSEDVWVTNGRWARRAYWMTRQKYWNFYHIGESSAVTHWRPIILPKDEK